MNNKPVRNLVSPQEYMRRTSIPHDEQFGQAFVKNGLFQIQTTGKEIKDALILYERGVVQRVFRDNKIEFKNINSMVFLDQKTATELYKISISNLRLEIKNDSIIEKPMIKINKLPKLGDFLTDSVKKGIIYRSNTFVFDVPLYETNDNEHVGIFNTVSASSKELKLGAKLIKKTLLKNTNTLGEIVIMTSDFINDMYANSFYGEIIHTRNIKLSNIKEKYPNHTTGDNFGQLQLINLRTDLYFHEYVIINGIHQKWAFFDPTNRLENNLLNPNDVIKFGTKSMIIKSDKFDYYSKRYTHTDCLLDETKR